MISYIKGELTEIFDDIITVENHGIGYEIRVPLSLIEMLPVVGNEVKVFTYFQVREDGVALYGFLSRQDLFMFQKLLGVSGIGPKAALGILSALSPDALRLAIFTGDAKAIAKAPGVGTKTAQRVILELKDKIDPNEILSPPEVTQEAYPSGMAAVGTAAREAIEALVALGYSTAEASRAVKQVEVTPESTAEEILKKSLRHLF